METQSLANAQPSRSLTIRTWYMITAAVSTHLLLCCPLRAYHKLFCPSVPIPSTCYLIWAFVAPPLLPSFYSNLPSFMRTKSTLALMDGISQLVLYILHFHWNFSSLSTVNHLQFEPYPIDGSFLEQQIFWGSLVSGKCHGRSLPHFMNVPSYRHPPPTAVCWAGPGDCKM